MTLDITQLAQAELTGYHEYDKESRTIIRWEVRKDLSLPDFMFLESKGLAKIIFGKPMVKAGAKIVKKKDCKPYWDVLGSKNIPVAEPGAGQGEAAASVPKPC